MAAVDGSTRRPRTATSPSTVTRPSSIRSSHARRLPNPARARTFWRRSPSPSVGVVAVLGRLVLVVGQAQAVLERLDHLGARDERAQRG